MIAHGNANAGVGVIVKKLLGKAFCLLAEHYPDVSLIFYVAIIMLRLRGKIIDRSVGVRFQEVGKRIVIGYIKLVPIVESGALELGVIDLKPERADEMQGSTRSGAGTRDIACILWNFGLTKDDVNV